MSKNSSGVTSPSIRQIAARSQSCRRWCGSWSSESGVTSGRASNLNVIAPWRRIPEGRGRLLAPTRQGRIGQLGVLGIVAALCLLIGFFIARQDRREVVAREIQLAPSLAGNTGTEARFVLPLMNATDVSVVGSFNAWEPIALSDDDGDGIWKVDIVLPPGRYEYAFLIDGRWWGHDPLADEYVRSFGEYSSVRYIRGGAGA
jgi:hypothetical protein